MKKSFGSGIVMQVFILSQRQTDLYEFEASLDYIARSNPATQSGKQQVSVWGGGKVT